MGPRARQQTRVGSRGQSRDKSRVGSVIRGLGADDREIRAFASGPSDIGLCLEGASGFIIMLHC